MNKFYFQKAQAIWAKGREKEKNCELAFRTVLTPGSAVLYLVASTIYRLFVNGEFAGAGPARTAHGFYCVDKIDLSGYLTAAENVVVIEVAGFNVNSYDTLDQPSFLTAEFIRDKEIIAYTGSSKIGVYDLKQRVQKVQRYSFQRAFAECYRLRAEDQSFFTQASCERQPEPCSVQSAKKYLKRSGGMPEFERLQAQALLETGAADFDYICPDPVRDRSYLNIGENLKGFLPEELEEHLSEECQNIAFYPSPDKEQSGAEGTELSCLPRSFRLRLENGYGLFCFPYNAAGFVRFTVECEENCRIYLLFDEILSDGEVNFLRMECNNCFKYSLDRGKHTIMTFAPYTMKYVQLVVRGSAVLSAPDMVEYKHPPVPFSVNLPEDETLRNIYQAALETYLANAVDVYSDCPSRERTGWLCDSFFTARVEYVLTGKSVLERSFLENFLLAEEFAHLPKGMLPMCYPADHNDGNFIPNWAMWFVLELEEYFGRSGDSELIDCARERVYGLLDYFADFENEHGLLENLQGWVFVEWSRANDKDVVQDINFPSNMLYMRMLLAAANLYGDGKLQEKARCLRKVIRSRSLKGVFYTDNEKRTADGTVNPGNMTEVCQYYAFFTGVATKQEDPVLWDILCRDFGYQRRKTRKYPEVAFANAFIGNYLRIELLYRDGEYEAVIDNIKGYFAKMAKRTGTLWEHDSPAASCNHGFASHVIYWLAGIYKTCAIK